MTKSSTAAPVTKTSGVFPPNRALRDAAERITFPVKSIAMAQKVLGGLRRTQ